MEQIGSKMFKKPSNCAFLFPNMFRKETDKPSEVGASQHL